MDLLLFGGLIGDKIDIDLTYGIMDVIKVGFTVVFQNVKISWYFF